MSSVSWTVLLPYGTGKRSYPHRTGDQFAPLRLEQRLHLFAKALELVLEIVKGVVRILVLVGLGSVLKLVGSVLDVVDEQSNDPRVITRKRSSFGSKLLRQVDNLVRVMGNVLVPSVPTAACPTKGFLNRTYHLADVIQMDLYLIHRKVVTRRVRSGASGATGRWRGGRSAREDQNISLARG